MKQVALFSFAIILTLIIIYGAAIYLFIDGESSEQKKETSECESVRCPASQQCVDGKCVARGKDGGVICGPTGMHCPGTYKECVNGQCTWVPGYGDCVDDKGRISLLTPGRHCSKGKGKGVSVPNQCDEKRCSGVTCGKGQSCNPVSGECDEKRKNGKCETALGDEVVDSCCNGATECPDGYNCGDQCACWKGDPCSHCPPKGFPGATNCYEGVCYEDAPKNCIMKSPTEGEDPNYPYCSKPDAQCRQFCCSTPSAL